MLPLVLLRRMWDPDNVILVDLSLTHHLYYVVSVYIDDLKGA